MRSTSDTRRKVDESKHLPEQSLEPLPLPASEGPSPPPQDSSNRLQRSVSILFTVTDPWISEFHQNLFGLVKIVAFDAGRLQPVIGMLAAVTLATNRDLRQQHVFAVRRGAGLVAGFTATVPV